MKKFLSLALALLMMIPFAASVGAAGTNTVYSSNPVKEQTVTVDEFAKILEYWRYLNDDDYDYDYFYNYFYGGTRRWVDYCDECGKVANYYVSNGKIYCACSNCDEIYEVYVPDLDDDDEEIKYTHVTHSSKDCEKNDVSFYPYHDVVFWLCSNCGQYGVFDIDDFYYDDDFDYDYSIRVICSKGGTYTIYGGGSYADYGDKRTISLTPERGYELTEVTINGVSYGYTPEINLVVKRDTVIRATFTKLNTTQSYTLTSTATGGGTIKAIKNNSVVSADKLSAKYSDSVTYKFTPASSNYYVSSVKVDGKSVGRLTSYTFDRITSSHKIEVEFAWKCPYSDINEKYLNAVEYVTEAKIMGYYNKYVNKNAFCGTNAISVKNLVAALAEMADVKDNLDTVAERIEWAEKKGLIDGDVDLTVICTVQTACDIVNDYLALLEDMNKISFDDYDEDDSAKENAISIGMVSSKAYKNDRNLNRYDLAAICNLIAHLDY